MTVVTDMCGLGPAGGPLSGLGNRRRRTYQNRKRLEMHSPMITKVDQGWGEDIESRKDGETALACAHLRHCESAVGKWKVEELCKEKSAE